MNVGGANLVMCVTPNVGGYRVHSTAAYLFATALAQLSTIPMVQSIFPELPQPVGYGDVLDLLSEAFLLLFGPHLSCSLKCLIGRKYSKSCIVAPSPLEPQKQHSAGLLVNGANKRQKRWQCTTQKG